MAVDAVIFDWGGTLTPWHTLDLREQWRAYTAVYDPVRADELAGELLAVEAASWAAARDHHRSATLDGVFVAAGIHPSGATHVAALAAYHQAWEPHTWTDPEVRPLLESLRERGLKVGLLSNTLWTRSYHEYVLERDGILELFDGAVYSSEVPWTKPHPEAFLSAMRILGVGDPSACVFVGDRPFDDIHGAKDVGMRAVLVPHSTIPHDQRGHTEGDPDAVVESLADLLAVVDAWR
ncbi:MAG TPA: HAD family hydrolase [Candidatus Limnocylindria bacterium]|nr:HAD family hydrolase [Candidatus Limnocylindria bacterium]